MGGKAELWLAPLLRRSDSIFCRNSGEIPVRSPKSASEIIIVITIIIIINIITTIILLLSSLLLFVLLVLSLFTIIN